MHTHALTHIHSHTHTHTHTHIHTLTHTHTHIHTHAQNSGVVYKINSSKQRVGSSDTAAASRGCG